jgi:Ca-activated chloride channel homolog
MHRRSNGDWKRVVAAAVFCFGIREFAVGQVAPGAPSQVPAAAPAQSGQVPPAIDSDPVPSPDPATPLPKSQSGGAGQAQDGQAGQGAGVVTQQGGRYTLRAEASEVRLDASVVDGSGREVEDLPKDAFHVYEDGVPQTILGFRHEDLPVSLGILIDSSGSMYDKRAAVDAASLDLVRLSNRQDEAFLVDFSSEAYIDQDFTSDIGKLQQGLSYIKSAGGTALYDAVIASADYLAKSAKRTKQVLLVVTDGDDNASSATLEQTIRRVQELDGPVIYCIGLLFGEDVSRSESRHSRQVLSELAEQTGGQAYFPHALKDVDGITREVAADIRQQYTIEYRSTKPPSQGGYRQVHVEAKGKGYGKLMVRTRAGYYPRTTANVGVPAAGGPGQ